MPFLRAVALLLTILFFLMVLAPVQIAIARWFPFARKILPVLFCRIMCALIGVRVRTEGVLTTGRPLLVVANHVSWLDVAVLGTADNVCFLAKHEVASWPLLGLLARVQGAIFVERGRKRAIPDVNRRMTARMLRGDPVVLFAEATTGDGTRMLKFHSSHFEAARAAADTGSAWVQPVFIDYCAQSGLPTGRCNRADAAWYGDSSFGPHLWRLLNGPPLLCRVALLPARAVSASTSRKAMARETLSEIRKGRRRQFADGSLGHGIGLQDRQELDATQGGEQELQHA